jgi:hypothetical protein
VKTKEIDLERLASEASVKGEVWGGGDRPGIRNTETWRLPFGCTDLGPLQRIASDFIANANN